MNSVSSKHIELLSIAARNLKRFRGRTVAIFIPLLIVMAVGSSASLIKDGLQKNEMVLIKDAPDLVLRQGGTRGVSQAEAREISAYEGVLKTQIVDNEKFGMVLGCRNCAYSGLGVYLIDPAQAVQVAQLIGASHENINVVTKDMLKDMIRLWYANRAGMFQLVWLILLLTVMLLAWTQACSINLEMAKEIGVLKSLGWQTLDIMELKMMEIILIGCSGILGGILLGVVCLAAGAPLLKQFFLISSQAGSSAALPLCVEPVSVMLLFIMGLLPLCAATIVPVWLMGTIEPDSAIRGG